MSLDGGLDQRYIVRHEVNDVPSELTHRPQLTDNVKAYYNPGEGSFRWDIQTGEFPEPFTMDIDQEVEIDLTGVGNGKPILGVTDEGTFQVLTTIESDEPFQFPENIREIVDLNSGKWQIEPNGLEISLKPVETNK